MYGCTPNFRWLLALTVAGATSLASITSSRAELIAGDSFFFGSGGYKAANLTDQPAKGASPSSAGFTGTFGKGPTSYLQPDALGLKSTATGYKGGVGGSIRMASNAGVDGESRSLTRAIQNSAANPATIYFSGLLQSPKTLSAARGGFIEFGNRNQPVVSGAFLGEGVFHKGFEVGIQGTSFVVVTATGGNRIVYSSSYSPLAGTNPASTNLFIAKLEIKPSGNDLLVVYLNPKDVSSEDQARQTAAVMLEFDDRNIANHPSEISNAGFRTISTASDLTPIFADEIRIGSTFEAVVAAVP